jgi:hypothetical protein
LPSPATLYSVTVDGDRVVVGSNEGDVAVIQGSNGMLLDMFGMFVEPLEGELGIKSNHRVGRFPTPPKARNTTTGSRPSTSHWRTTTARATPTCSSPT